LVAAFSSGSPGLSPPIGRGWNQGLPLNQGDETMNANNALILAIGLGFATGLRSFTAPAMVSWAARLGWLDLRGTPLAFMGSTVAVALLSLLAIVE
jgi:hypothetical protein